MRRKLLQTLATCLVFSCATLLASEHSQIKAFPAAETGMFRFVIELSPKTREEEHAFKVELVAGKTMQTDGVNQVRLGSSVEPKPLKGWGYTYYEVKPATASMTTLMAAPEGAPQVSTFVTTAPLIVPYNSRIPIVVYLPEGYELRYRIWAADQSYQPAGQG